MSSIKDLIEYKLKKDKFVKCVKRDEISLPKFGTFKLFVYKNLIDETEHLVLVKGKITKNKSVLVRMHSLNIISDLLDLKNKDLEKSIEIISKNDQGVIVIVRNPDKEMKKKNSILSKSKNKILKELTKFVFPHFKNGQIKCYIDSVFSLSEASKAHKRLDEGVHIGKVILKI